jgi:ankyrin repeat protein
MGFNCINRFLLVRFHVEFICQQVSAKQVLKALASLKMAPKKNPLDPTYERIVNFIRGQPQSNMELALSILSWIIKARRILRLNELQTAISVEPETYELDELNLPDKDVILDICGGLVTVDESENVRFVHYTVQEYLVNNRIIPEDSDLTTALTCITYLSFDVFTANCNEDPVSPYKLRLIYPFLGYASRYLYSHLRSCEENLTADALVYHLEKQGHSLSYLYYTLHEEVSPLQMAAKLGHCLAFQMLLDNGHNISVCDGDGNTVLHYVAMAESKEMAKFLLNKKAVSIMALNDNGRSPLMIAALRGNDEIARILIDHGANIFDQDFYGTTVAGLAASNGHCALMQLLIENGVDPTGGSDSCWSPFESAILTGHEKVVELLIQRINFADLPLRPDSLLIDAIEFGYRGIARMLIEKGYDLSSQNREGSTALHWAAFSDWEDIVRLMLERGADISVRSTSTRLLFSNITKRDNHIMFGKTALEIAISEGHDSIEAILVAEMKDLTGDELIQQDEAPVLPILDSQYM